MGPGPTGGSWSGRTEQRPCCEADSTPRPPRARFATPSQTHVPTYLRTDSINAPRSPRVPPGFPDSSPQDLSLSVCTSARTSSLVSCLVQTHECPPEDAAVLPHDTVPPPVLRAGPLCHTRSYWGTWENLHFGGTVEVSHAHTHTFRHVFV